MSLSSQKPNTTGIPALSKEAPTASPLSTLTGLAAGTLAVVLIFLTARQVENGTAWNVVSWVFGLFDAGRYVPALSSPPEKIASLTLWFRFAPLAAVSFLTCSFIAKTVMSVLLATPRRSMLEDPEMRPSLLGIDTPPLSHLDAMLICAPRSGGRMSLVRECIASGAMSLMAPPSISVAISDRPVYASPDDVKRQKRETKIASRRIRRGTGA